MNKTKLMSKKKIIVFSIIICIAIIATFYFLGCNKKSFTGDINLNEISGQSSTVKAKPVDGSTPADHAPNDNFYYALGDLLSAGSFIGESESSSTSLGVKQVIFSGPKTIVFWLDGTKTIVSCGEGDHNDPYAGFCAAVTKRVFGSTSQAKKVLARTRKETSK